MCDLFVSDLDGTLLRSDETVSKYTGRVINSLVEKGMIFSYATARSLITAKKVTKGLNARIPLIVYNGAFVIDNVTEQILIANYFDSSVESVLEDLFRHDVYPIVYSYIDGREKFSFVPDFCTPDMRLFLDTRKGDIRTNIVTTPSELKKGDIFYITCIGEPAKLQSLYDKYKDIYHCVYQVDIYTNAQWLEIMPSSASKSNAIRQLRTLLKCEQGKLIVFGDGKNDIDMFRMADESYAVANAHADLKKHATAVIASNDDDGVARWLEANYSASCKLRKWRLSDAADLTAVLNNKKVLNNLRDASADGLFEE